MLEDDDYENELKLVRAPRSGSEATVKIGPLSLLVLSLFFLRLYKVLFLLLQTELPESVSDLWFAESGGCLRTYAKKTKKSASRGLCLMKTKRHAILPSIAPD